MKKLVLGNHLTPYLLLACAILAVVLYLQSSNILDAQEDASPSTPITVDPPKIRNFTAPSIAAFREISERPLFLVGRQPPPKPKPKPRTTVRVMPLRLQLEGVVISTTEKVAMLLDLSNNEVLHLTTGMTHQGWELISIDKTVATFKRGAQTQELALPE